MLKMYIFDYLLHCAIIFCHDAQNDMGKECHRNPPQLLILAFFFSFQILDICLFDDRITEMSERNAITTI